MAEVEDANGNVLSLHKMGRAIALFARDALPISHPLAHLYSISTLHTSHHILRSSCPHYNPSNEPFVYHYNYTINNSVYYFLVPYTPPKTAYILPCYATQSRRPLVAGSVLMVCTNRGKTLNLD